MLESSYIWRQKYAQNSILHQNVLLTHVLDIVERPVARAEKVLWYLKPTEKVVCYQTLEKIANYWRMLTEIWKEDVGQA